MLLPRCLDTDFCQDRMKFGAWQRFTSAVVLEVCPDSLHGRDAWKDSGLVPFGWPWVLPQEPRDRYTTLVDNQICMHVGRFPVCLDRLRVHLSGYKFLPGCPDTLARILPGYNPPVRAIVESKNQVDALACCRQCLCINVLCRFVWKVLLTFGPF